MPCSRKFPQEKVGGKKISSLKTKVWNFVLRSIMSVVTSPFLLNLVSLESLFMSRSNRVPLWDDQNNREAGENSRGSSPVGVDSVVLCCVMLFGGLDESTLSVTWNK